MPKGRGVIQISVIVPLYNKKEYIKRTLLSLLLQKGIKEYEVIVIDNGSTDGSFDIVKEMDNPHIKLITESKKGVSSARNRGIKEAKGEYIAFLDADDCYKDYHLKHLTDLAKSYPKENYFATTYEIKSECDNLNQEYIDDIEPKRVSYTDMVLNGRFDIVLCSMLFKRDYLVKNHIYFNESMSIGEDVNFVLRVAKEPLWYIDTKSYIYSLEIEGSAMNSTKALVVPNYFDKVDTKNISDTKLKKFLVWEYIKYGYKNRGKEFRLYEVTKVFNSKYRLPFYAYILYLTVRFMPRVLLMAIKLARGKK